MKGELENAESLDLEVSNDALSFEIEKTGVRIFDGITMFDGLMERLIRTM